MATLPLSFRVDRSGGAVANPPGSSNAEAEEDAPKMRPPTPWQYLRSGAWARPLLTVAGLYVCCLALVYALFRTLPSVDEVGALAAAAGGGGGATANGAASPSLRLALPRSFDELRAARQVLVQYHAAVPARLGVFLAATHMFLQTFLTPGAVGINVLVGSLYHPTAALAWITAVSTAGSATNYLLVRWKLKAVVVALLPQRIAAFSAEVRRHHAHLLNYALFLRVTPIFPAWFINVASPLVDLPFGIFLFATAVGHQPHNVIAIQASTACAGRSLQTMHSVHDLYSIQNVALLLGIGLVALLPRLISSCSQRRRGATLLPLTGPGSSSASMRRQAT